MWTKGRSTHLQRRSATTSGARAPMNSPIDFDSNPYSFSIDGLDTLTFRVRSFTGKQQISDVYSFDIVVDTEIATEDAVEQLALGQKATFSWDLGGKGPRTFYGVVAKVRA